MSDIEDHLDGEPGHMIMSYRVVKKLGTGTFGRVFLCDSTAQTSSYQSVSKHKHLGRKKFKQFHGKGISQAQQAQERALRDEEALAEAESSIKESRVAVKVIRPVDKYIDEAKDECSVMRRLDCPHIIKLIDSHEWKDRFVMVLPAYGLNLYHVLKKRDYAPIKTSLCVKYIEQVLVAVSHMHSRGFAHTDIKPENILVEDMSDISKGVKLIDLGGVYEAKDYGDGIVQTRQYRAPEVILGNGWDEKADIWSIGCTLAEMYLGELLFPAHDDRTHLAMIERCVGDFPAWMSMSNRNFEEGSVKFPCMGQSAETIDSVCCLKTLKQYFGYQLVIYALIRRMLVIDPTERMGAQELVDKIGRWRAKGKIE